MKTKPSEDRVKQITRLEKMAGDSMKAELKIWLRQRLQILRMLELQKHWVIMIVYECLFLEIYVCGRERKYGTVDCRKPIMGCNQIVEGI